MTLVRVFWPLLIAITVYAALSFPAYSAALWGLAAGLFAQLVSVPGGG